MSLVIGSSDKITCCVYRSFVGREDRVVKMLGFNPFFLPLHNLRASSFTAT